LNHKNTNYLIISNNTGMAIGERILVFFVLFEKEKLFEKYLKRVYG